MTKFRTYLVVLITATLFLAELSWQATPYKKGKCYFKGKFYEPGEKIYTKPCSIWSCIKTSSTHSYVFGKTCPLPAIRPGCKLSPTKEGIFPKCCPDILCP
uniref:8.9 kDa family member n=1 Tax=Rhipicephalus zambeziensis TaxID=60191 RepID=A0A224YAI8_9ACAR